MPNEANIFEFALKDKKNRNSVLMMSLPDKIGKMHITSDLGYRTPVAREVFRASIRLLGKSIR